MKKILSFTVTLAILLSFVSLSAYASEYKDIRLTKDQLALDAFSVIEDALLKAKGNANDSLVYRIYVPSGEYNLNSGLHVHSNTQLYLDDDTVFNRSFVEGNMLKLGKKEEITEKYSGYRNIVVSGGTWNSGYIGTSCAMRFAHCTNVTVQNLTINDKSISSYSTRILGFVGTLRGTIKNLYFDIFVVGDDWVEKYDYLEI